MTRTEEKHAASEKLFAERRTELFWELSGALDDLSVALTPDQIDAMASAGADAIMDAEQAARDRAEQKAGVVTCWTVGDFVQATGLSLEMIRAHGITEMRTVDGVYLLASVARFWDCA